MYLLHYICNRNSRCLIGLVLLLATATTPAASPLILKTNGGWCWFQDQRAVLVDDKLIFASVAGDEGGGWEAGDLVATCYDLKTEKTSHFELHSRFQRDDHDVAALCVLPDKRVLAVYGKHGNDSLQRWRITAGPADISEWTMERTFDVGAGYTYSNVYPLESENGRIYNFHRGRGFNPNCTVSDDRGESWRYGWRLLEWTRRDLENDLRFTGMDGRRPYLNYASNGKDTIHFIVTDDHPRAYDNSIYHGFYRDGRLLRSDGSVAGLPGTNGTSQLKPRSFTEVFEGGPDRVAWTSDIQLDGNGHPYIAFSVQVDGAAARRERTGRVGLDHRYYHGRWDGSRWHVHEMAYAGTRIYSGEDDYTGLVALDPHDPDTAFISTNADPATGKPLVSAADNKRHWELYQGRTSDGGRTWTWTAVTRDSSQDNLRPVIPIWPDGPRVVLWTRGTMKTYTNYRLDIVALVGAR